jgi:class 3 adenylate cyclase
MPAVASRDDAGTPGRAEDELRPVTALFADIVGSMALGERLAPDEVKALVGECVSRMSRAIEEFGGTVQAYMGDGICAYFGVPVAHEDDPERAGRAALRIVELVGEYARDVAVAWGIEGFNVRVGINSGQAAVGPVGAGAPQEVALGDTPNVAARLQSLAEPGTIALGGGTAERLAQRFVLEPIGEVSVKGRNEPVAAWRLVRARVAARETPANPLVGRDREFERLRGAVEELAAGRGQVLLIVGDAGIGKTRLLDELRAIAGTRVTWLEGECVSYGGELLLWPCVQILKSWLGVEDAEPDVAVRTKLRARLGARLPEALPGLARLLAIRLEPGIEARLGSLSPDELAAEIRTAYRAWVGSLAAERPVVVALEDAHWADASTRELAEELLELTDRAPVLVAVTTRQDPASEGFRFRLRVLADYPHRTLELVLGPLSDEAAGRLLGAMVPGVLDAGARREIVERAEGNPLYLEELLRALVEGGGLVRRRTWTLNHTAAAELLPPAIENLLVARVDRLPEEARQLAQVAAVAGRSFPVRVLEQVVGTEKVARTLPILLRAEIVREVRRYPELECTFKHGLLQEAALSTLTAERRRDLHGRVARGFEEVFADSLEEHLEILAQLYARSDELETALEYLVRAAARAEEFDAGPQAVELRRRADKVKARIATRGS